MVYPNAVLDANHRQPTLHPPRKQQEAGEFLWNAEVL